MKTRQKYFKNYYKANKEAIRKQQKEYHKRKKNPLLTVNQKLKIIESIKNKELNFHIKQIIGICKDEKKQAVKSKSRRDITDVNNKHKELIDKLIKGIGATRKVFTYKNYHQEYRRKDWDGYLEYQREYYHKNKEKMRKYHLDYYHNVVKANK